MIPSAKSQPDLLLGRLAVPGVASAVERTRAADVLINIATWSGVALSEEGAIPMAAVSASTGVSRGLALAGVVDTTTVRGVAVRLPRGAIGCALCIVGWLGSVAV